MTKEYMNNVGTAESQIGLRQRTADSTCTILSGMPDSVYLVNGSDYHGSYVSSEYEKTKNFPAKSSNNTPETETNADFAEPQKPSKTANTDKQQLQIPTQQNPDSNSNFQDFQQQINDGTTSNIQNSKISSKSPPKPSKHRLCMEGTTQICAQLSLTQELSKVMRNVSIEIISCHVKINKPIQLLPQTDEEKFIRKNREYRDVRENLKKLVTHLMFKNKTILFEHVDDWLLNNVIVTNTASHRQNDSDSSKFKQNSEFESETLTQNSNLSSQTSYNAPTSSKLQKTSIIMPKLRNFFSDLISRTFDTNTSLSYDIKNWIMIASVHMIGVIICESFQNQTKDKESLITVIKLVSGTVSDFITTRHMHFIESIGSWTQLRFYRVTKNGQLILPDFAEDVMESSATSNTSSFYPESEAGSSGGFDFVMSGLIAGAVATLGVLTYAKLK